MAHRTALDRAVETATITGTGDYSLAGAVTGFVTLATAGMANGDTALLHVEAVDANGVPNGGWEIGLYTWNTGPTLTRTSILKGSNGTSPVSWGASTLVRIAATVASYNLGAIVQAFAASGTWTKPTGRTFHMVEQWGAGGGGASGGRYASGGAANSSAGGGGAYCCKIFLDADLSATESVTVGAGGAGGASVTTNDTGGSAGSNGGNTSFGTYLYAYGGEGGTSGNPGGGGGVLSAGGHSYPNSLGAPAITGGTYDQSMGGGYFGASGVGGGSGAADGNPGYTSKYGGGGGGSGGDKDAAGGAGGGNEGQTGGGGAAGTSGAVNGTAGASGKGGGGGYGKSAAAAGAGGPGGRAGGGGAGGKSGNGFASGAGGIGGDGYCRVLSW